jgi:trehalose/maltose transport system substrate-binding protein
MSADFDSRRRLAPAAENSSRCVLRRSFQVCYLVRRLLLAVLVLTAWGTGLEERAAQPVRLAVAGFGPDAGDQLRRDGLDEFTRKTGIRVDFIPTWGTSTDQLTLTLRMMERQLRVPDVYLIDVIWPGTLQQYLLDLTPYLNVDDRNQMPELLRNDTVSGRVVSLPFYMNVGMLYYRSDLLEKYGYGHPPATWNELERMSARIPRGERATGHAGFWGYVWQGHAYEGLTCNALEWQVSFGGGRVIEPDGRISVNNSNAAKAFHKATGWIGSISPASVLSYTESDSLNAFRSGNAAFLRYWSSGFSANHTRDSAVSGRVKLALLPAGPQGRAQTMGGFQLAVSRYSAYPREAAQLVVYLTGSKIQKRRALQGGYLPTIPDLYHDPELLKALPQAEVLRNAGLESWVARPSTVAGARYAAISRAYYETVHSILSRQCEAEQGLKSLERQLMDLVSGLNPSPQ